VYNQSAFLSKRIGSEVGDENKIRKAYQLIYQRPPSTEEIQAALDFLRQDRARFAPATLQTESPSGSGVAAVSEPVTAPADPAPRQGTPRRKENSPPADPWANYVRVLLSSNEFLYVD
jgi:hypothetical protein